MEQVVNLERFEAKSFMGIDQSKPIVIDFASRKKNQNIIELVGDEALCKTSTICGILYAMGGALNIDKKELFNTIDGALDVNLKFEYDEEKYEVIVKNDRITLKKYNEESDKWKTQDEPMATLRRIFGPVGLSPFRIKQLEGKKQIEFFQEMFGSGEDTKKKHKKLEDDYDKLYSDRREINRVIKSLNGALQEESLYLEYEKNQKRFKNPINAEKEKQRYDELAKKNSDYNMVKDQKLPALEERLKNKKDEIADLERQLAAAKASEIELTKGVSDYKKWVADNKGIEKEYAAANENWLNMSKLLSEQARWKDVLKKEKELNDCEAASAKATQQLQDLDLEILKLTKSYMPKIDGLKMVVKPSIDKEKEEIGVFYNGKSMAQLNESAFVKMWAEIFFEKGIYFLFFENLNSYGSTAVSLLNELAKEGATIFGSRLERKKRKLEINFNSKIE